MAELTPSGVCYDLPNSPFVQSYKGFKFYFSSETHREKFIRTVKIKEEWLNDSLTRRFKFNVSAEWIAIFQNYIRIETRGFHVVDNEGRVWKSKEDLCLSIGRP